MEIYASREPFVFTMSVIGSTQIDTIVNKLTVIVLQCIMTTLFVYLGIFALVVPYFFLFYS